MGKFDSFSPRRPAQDLEIVRNAIREGRFQRSLSLLTAASSVISGLEVAYEHYRGSYSNRVMYTPVILSFVLACAGLPGFSAVALRAHFCGLPHGSPWPTPASGSDFIFAASTGSQVVGGCQ